MKIAIAQYQPSTDLKENLLKAIEEIKKAAQQNIDLICFSEYFLGRRVKLDEGTISGFVKAVASAGVEVVTGNFLKCEDDILREATIYLNERGEIAGTQLKINLSHTQEEDVVSGEVLTPIRTSLGRIIILCQLDALDARLTNRLDEFSPDALVLQLSSVSVLEQEAARELATNLSLGRANLVMVPSLVGGVDGKVYLGGSFIAYQGEVIAEALDREEQVVTEINPKNFVKYKGLTSQVFIPELFRQKFECERKK